MAPFAHSLNREGQRHDLETHLRTVAQMAAEFAAPFGGDGLARLLGLWHDVGKFNPAFQAYLASCEADPDGPHRGPDHKASGSRIATQHAQVLALLIQGHHGGMNKPEDLAGWLHERADDPAVADAVARARRAMTDIDPAVMPSWPPHSRRDLRAHEFFLRMLFSALVDADHLDTERHFNGDRVAHRGTAIVDMEELWARFAHDQQRVTGKDESVVGRVRHEVYQSCLAAAELPPGLFRLAVPTGGGKTRSGMGFALRHALAHDLRRVIVAVPFISITEQTADTYRAIFESRGEGDAAPPSPSTVVLEHHSGVRDDATAGPWAQRAWARAAAENWDAPLIVTTTVQLLESLFARRPSAVRKDHRLARSVIILDEAQALPAHLLTPILDALRQLCLHYGATVVLSTATQPAFDEIPAFADLPATEIVPDAPRHFALLERVTYEWVEEPLEWTEVAALMRAQTQVLTIVNTKRDALALLDALDDPAVLHLSTLLCGAHRRAVLAEVIRRLKAGEPCRLVSTQCIEAGVDVDFPVVLRALGPLDSIVQAAGRCNREGLLGGRGGRVVVFCPRSGGLPSGAYRIATGITSTIITRKDGDLGDPSLARAYFQRLFRTVETDREGIQERRAALDYPAVAQKFRMIDEETESVIITTYGSPQDQRMVRAAIAELRQGSEWAREVMRRLQPYIVSVRVKEAARYREQDVTPSPKTGGGLKLTEVLPGVGEWHGTYHVARGVGVD